MTESHPFPDRPGYPGPGGPPPAAPSGPPPALALRSLTKAFGPVLAVNAINLDVPTGSMYGFVGPNGAGKTTALSMATGLLTPDAGAVYLGGIDLWANLVASKARIGVLPDGLRLFDRLSGAELLTYTGLLRGMDRATVVARGGQILDALGLAADASKLVADYSAGMTKKIALACAVIAAPDLLVLDEPFEAIDPVSAQSIQTMLRDFTAAGGTVILSSHVMATVQALCDHVAIIAQGHILVAGTVDQVAAGASLEQRFLELLGGGARSQELSWLRPSSR